MKMKSEYLIYTRFNHLTTRYLHNQRQLSHPICMPGIKNNVGNNFNKSVSQDILPKYGF